MRERNEEILYLMDFLSVQKPNENYNVYFEFGNYIFESWRLAISFKRKGYKENEVILSRDFLRGLQVKRDIFGNRKKEIQIDSDSVSDGLLIAQNLLAQMEWIPLETKKSS
ncbi:hypothetical protein [Vagococcus fluvialis]|uniref:hypothetical protein n=1 Tax=Vagococcus fluvialis TaxID=2738 RepID=UPI003794FF88